MQHPVALPRHVRAEHPHRPRRRRDQAEDHSDGRGLAGAVAAQQPGDDDADNEGPQVSVLRTIGEPGVGDGHAGLAAEERGEPDLDAARGKVVNRIRPQPGDRAEHDRDDRDLPQQCPESLVIKRERHARAGRVFGS